MDIVCLACLIILSTLLDRHGYFDVIPRVEILQREHVVTMYRLWRRWFVSKYMGRTGGVTVDWEEAVFTVSLNVVRLFQADLHVQPMLLHLAHVLLRYHKQEAKNSANADSHVLVRYDFEAVRKKVAYILERYSAGLGDKLDMVPQHSGFWLYSGEEFSIQVLI
jgi:hypothetical protein